MSKGQYTQAPDVLPAFDVRIHPLKAGVHLLEASAGTGKTYSITGLILRLLTEGVDGQRLLLSDILVVTFTRAATAELKERIQSRLAAAAQSLRDRERWVEAGQHGPPPEEPDPLLKHLCDTAQAAGDDRLTEWRQWLTTARANIDTAPISTIHSFCQRVLTANSFDTGAVSGRTILQNIKEIVMTSVRDWHARTINLTESILGDDGDEVMDEVLGALKHHKKNADLEQLVVNRVNALINESPDAPSLPEFTPVNVEQRLRRARQVLERLAACMADGVDEESRSAMVAFAATTLCGKSGNVQQNKGFYESLGIEKVPDGTDAAGYVEHVIAHLASPGNLQQRMCRVLFWHGDWGTLIQLSNARKGVGGSRFVDGVLHLTPEASAAWERYAATPFARAIEAILDEYGVDEPLDLLTELGREIAVAGVYDAHQWTLRELERRMSVPSNATIHELARALNDPSGGRLVDDLRSTYKCALIDEFQDTDTAQWSIFRAMYGVNAGHAAGLVFLIGDPKQAIYEFRGANIHAYLAAKAESTPEFRRTLDTNYRSDAVLVDAMNELMGHGQRDFFGASGISYLKVAASHSSRCVALGGQPLKPLSITEITFPPESEKELRKELTAPMIRVAVAKVRELQQSGTVLVNADGSERAVRFGDMAILCDSNANADRIHAALTRANIPAMRWSETSVFDSREARELYQLLGALATTDREALRSFASSRLGGATAAELVAWDEEAERSGVWWMTLFEKARKRLWTSGYSSAIAHVLQSVDAWMRLTRYEDGERALANTHQLMELIQGAAGVGARQKEPTVVQEWLGGRILTSHKGNSDEEDSAQTRLERDKDSVAVLTIHKSKGLEFPFVFLPFLQTSALVSGTASAKNPLQLRALDAQEQGWMLSRPVNTVEWEDDAPAAGFEGLTWDRWNELRTMESTRERLRQLYVAVTRASRQLQIFYAGLSDKDKSNTLLHALFYDGDIAELIVDNQASARVDDRMHNELSAWVEFRTGHDDGRWPAPEPLPSATSTLLAALPRPDVRVDHAWKIGSYSGLSPAHLSLAPVASPAVVSAAVQPEERGVLESGLVGFWAGTKAGSFLHRLYELFDFVLADSAAAPSRDLVDLVREESVRHGFNPRSFDVDRLCDDFVRTLRHPLGGPVGALGLARVQRRDRQDEAKFLLGVTQQAGGVSARRILDILLENEPELFTEDYRAALQQMGEGALTRAFHGLLTGFIDLVFRAEVDGQVQYFVLDYKSNRLHDPSATSVGGALASYNNDAVVRAMSEHHYFMQYHLYILALHRWLALRIPGYDRWSAHGYQQHLGGAYYLFIRGMALAGHTSAAAGAGVFFHRPKFETIHALDLLFEGHLDQEAS